MELYKAPIFDSWIDGNMTLASRIVKIFNNSNNFTLTEYDGRDEFYNEYLSKYNEYVDILKNISNDKNINSYLYVLHNVLSALNILADKHILNYSHLLVAYVQIFIYMDTVKGIIDLDENHEVVQDENIYHLIQRENIYLNSTIDDILFVLHDYHNKYPRIVPFTSQTGAFGMNTFLYLYLNDIYPVACSDNPYLVHNGGFQGSINVMGHDYIHLIMNNIMYNYKNMKYFVNSSEDNDSEYIKIIKQVYRSIFNNNFSDGQIKAFIMILFLKIHEEGLMIDCSNKILEINEELPLFLRNTYYTPERYNINYNYIYEYIINKNIQYKDISEKYINYVKEEMFDDFCKYFGNLIKI